MEYVKDVLNLAPSEWEDATYTESSFVLKDVDPNSEEFRSVTIEFGFQMSNIEILSVWRIQHPFAYGRFMLHKEQMQKKRKPITERREVVSFTGDFSEVKTFIDYNCDERRRGHSFMGGKYYVVKQVLIDSPQRDTHWYPQYLVQYR